MRNLLLFVAAAATFLAALLHVLGYVWHRPPAPLYYAVLLINYAPKWVWLFPAVTALFLSLGARRSVMILSIALFVIVLWMQDIQVKGLLHSPERAGTPVTMLTLNTGGTSADRVAELVKSYNPDIIMLQESQQKSIESVVNGDWRTHCTGHICFASQYAFDLLEAFNRTTFSDWGSFAAAYDVRIGDQVVRVVNTHLETPRDALGGRPLIDFSQHETDTYAYEKHTELAILSTLLGNGQPGLVAGDLNTVVFEAAYREHLGMYTNAIDHAASGVNYTKYTRWHGVRIDHVITNQEIKIYEARVLRDTGGDHRAILVKFLVGQ